MNLRNRHKFSGEAIRMHVCVTVVVMLRGVMVVIMVMMVVMMVMMSIISTAVSSSRIDGGSLSSDRGCRLQPRLKNIHHQPVALHPTSIFPNSSPHRLRIQCNPDPVLDWNNKPRMN